MGYTFKKEYRNWVEYRELPGLREVDFHFDDDENRGSFWETMEGAKERTIRALKRYFEDPEVQYVMFTHGWSTSGRGRESSRSVVRKVMQSTDATPYIDRKNCIQHDSVFVAALKKREDSAG